MQNVNIDIDRKYIYEYVTTLTGTLGRQKNEYDRFVCLPDNYAALDRFMDTAIAVIEASIWRKLSSSYSTTLKYNNGSLTISINNDSFPEKLKGVLYTNTQLALAYILTAMWLQGIEPDYYTQYANIADNYINKISIISGQHSTNDASYEEACQDVEQDAILIRTGGNIISDNKPTDELANTSCGNSSITDDADVNELANTSCGNSSITDDADVNELPNARFGEKSIKDCHVNKNSCFDNAIYYPDGSVMSY